MPWYKAGMSAGIQNGGRMRSTRTFRIFFLWCFTLLLPEFSPAQSYLPLFTTVIEAHQHCPYDVVVWIKSQKAGLPRYKGQPKSTDGGGYVCRQEAADAGYGGLVTTIQPVNKKP
jgi:hypothetical protein